MLFDFEAATSAMEKKSAKRNAEIKAAKEFSRKHPDRYFPVVDSVDIPLRKSAKGTETKLRIVIQRDGNDDQEDVENALCLDVRTFIKKPSDDWIHTAKGIHIPYELAAHLANTILEMIEDCEALKAQGKNF